ncbi:hypothetical protein EDB19DRAFT_1708479 [Suillus lakei]|nr:hypothetical protein EDB19DRAFT_1708479 [Suillus lakei]
MHSKRSMMMQLCRRHQQMKERNIFSANGAQIDYIRLPPVYIPCILHVYLDAGTARASKNGVFKTNFPLDGGVFERNKC